MRSVTLWPGSCPPSPGFEPWAILISSSSARARYAVVTPKRPDATCLMRLSARSLPSSGVYVAGSSPPSPELERAWMRFIAIASVACASGDSAPSDIALEMKRRRIASTGSTSSIGTGACGFKSSQAGGPAGGGARSSGQARLHAAQERRVVAVLQRAHDRRRPAVIFAVTAVADAAVIGQCAVAGLG